VEIPAVSRPADPAQGAFRRWLADLLPVQGDAVDLGTGTGRVALEVAPHARSVVGVDVDANALEAARWDAARRAIANVRFVQADAERTDLRDLNAGHGFSLLTARLFLSPALVPRAAQAAEPGGHLLVEALEAENWREAGGSRFNLAAADVVRLLGEAGFDVRDACIERDVQRFADAKAAQAYLKDHRLWTKWRADGRWETLRASLRAGGTLTQARVVVRARRT